MAKIGFFSVSAYGHVTPLMTLAGRMRQRGHEVTYFQLPDHGARAKAAGVGFAAFGVAERPEGAIQREFEEASKLEGLEAFERVIGALLEESRLALRDLPELVRDAGIEFGVVDECFDARAAVMHAMGTPFASAALALTYEWEPGIPSWACPLPFSEDPDTVAQYAVWAEDVDGIANILLGPINEFRAAHGQPGVELLIDTHSNLLRISQQPACFDYPRKELPGIYHHTGPFLDAGMRPAAPFPWERLDGRPLVYAAMGTLQNRMPEVWRAIAEACGGLDAQVVMSLGGGMRPEELGPLPANTIAVGYAPQPELLARASAMITHAGMNSTLECLANGVPMLAIPVAHDQMHLAQLIAWKGAGRRLPLEEVTAGRVREELQEVLSDGRYRETATRIRGEIAAADGLNRAAALVEEAIRTGAPVLRPN